MTEIRGVHLVLDGYVNDAKRLEPAGITAMFDQLVEALSMQYLHRPMAIQVPEQPERLHGDEDEGGWSVFAQITTSHIAIHCWPLRKAFMMDVFSCRAFDVARAKSLIYKALDVDLAVTKTLERQGPAKD